MTDPFEKFLDENTSLTRTEISDIYKEYAILKRKYAAAISEVRTKLEILNDEFNMSHEHNPIHHMESRVKTPASILEKLERRGFGRDASNLAEKIYDIAGIRVICPYIHDVYEIANLLMQQAGISLIKKSDYIENPKENGYRSLHIVIRVPVFFSSGIEYLPVEIQLRTIAMDFWASLEHEISYKSSGDIPQFISDELYECSKVTHESDLKMQRIHNFLDELDTIKNNND